MAPRSFGRPNTFEIDLDAIGRCVAQIRDYIGPDIYFFATLKANAYGYGLLPVARSVLASGANALSLVSCDDAIALREAGINVPILVYANDVPDEAIVRAVEAHELIPTLHNEESRAVYARHARRKIPVAVKVEIGPERIGVPAERAAQFVKAVSESPMLKVEVLNCHPSVTPHGRRAECLDWQYGRFVAVCRKLERDGIEIPYRIAACSNVLRIAGQSMLLNAVDPGDALFSPLDRSQAGPAFQSFHALTSRLIEVREVTRTEFLEEAPFPVTPGMRVGVIPIGYSDGMRRLNCGEVLVQGKRVKILTAPALEYTRIDLTSLPQARVGDLVTIIGRDGNFSITPEEVAQHQSAARVADLALEVRHTIARRYIGGPV